MSNGIVCEWWNHCNPEYDEFWDRANDEVNHAVEMRENIYTQGKNIELLIYQQKVAEFKRLYYQWIYAWIMAGISIFTALSINKIIDLTNPNGNTSLFYVAGTLGVLCLFILLYFFILKPKFDCCQANSLTIEREIRKINIKKKKGNSGIPYIQ